MADRDPQLEAEMDAANRVETSPAEREPVRVGTYVTAITALAGAIVALGVEPIWAVGFGVIILVAVIAGEVARSYVTPVKAPNFEE